MDEGPMIVVQVERDKDLVAIFDIDLAILKL